MHPYRFYYDAASSAVSYALSELKFTPGQAIQYAIANLEGVKEDEPFLVIAITCLAEDRGVASFLRDPDYADILRSVLPVCDAAGASLSDGDREPFLGDLAKARAALGV